MIDSEITSLDQVKIEADWIKPVLLVGWEAGSLTSSNSRPPVE